MEALHRMWSYYGLRCLSQFLRDVVSDRLCGRSIYFTLLLLAGADPQHFARGRLSARRGLGSTRTLPSESQPEFAPSSRERTCTSQVEIVLQSWNARNHGQDICLTFLLSDKYYIITYWWK